MAAGLLIRHSSPMEKLAPEMILTGKSLAMHPARAHYAKVPVEALQQLDSLADLEADHLHRRICKDLQRFDLESTVWLDAMVRHSQNRDRFEGVRMLLAWRMATLTPSTSELGTTRSAGLAGALQARLCELDTTMLNWMATMHREPELPDDWLWSVATLDPAAWWGKWAIPVLTPYAEQRTADRNRRTKV